MAKVIQKMVRVPKVLWEHKKKTAFGAFLAYLGGDTLNTWIQNHKIRSAYAILAVKYGQQPISAEDRPRRVCVLANVAANERHCFDDFKKNALPLLHLAGIQVDIIKADSEKQLESLAAAVDYQEADALFVVGGDGTIGTVITGIFRNRDIPAVPIGIFSGGYDNLTLKRLVPAVFETTADVRRHCESVMAVIEEEKRKINIFECIIQDDASKPLYSIGDVSAGWFRHIEEKRRKLWYFGSLKRRWAYIWEMIKRSPENFEATVSYEEFCSGCQNCREPIVFTQPEWRWWHILTGTPRAKLPEVMPKDYSNVENANCGKKGEIGVKGNELLIASEQIEDTSQLHLRVGGSDVGRFGVISNGWKRCYSDVVGSSPDSEFYTENLIARSINMHVKTIPEFIRKLYVDSNNTPIEEGQTVSIRVTNKKIEVYLPKELRIDLQQL